MTSRELPYLRPSVEKGDIMREPNPSNDLESELGPSHYRDPQLTVNFTDAPAKNESSLVNLPIELHLQILHEFDGLPNAAVCFGLTCKKLYPIFKACHPENLKLDRLRLEAGYRFHLGWSVYATLLPPPPPPKFPDPELKALLKGWVPSNMKYDRRKGKFVMNKKAGR